MTLSFTVYGRPVGKQRPRLGKGGHVYTPAETVRYERMVAWAALNARPPGWNRLGPMEVELACYFADARRHDADNLLKAVLDAMNGFIYDDDSQVCAMTATKAIDRDNPRIEVTVRSGGK